MFNNLDIDNPFYINNNFDFSSSSDSDSDFDFNTDTNMSALNQIHTSGSTIHKDLIAFFKANPISEDMYAKNIAVISAMYEANGAWTEYANAVNAYSNDATDEERLAKATKIGEAATQVRMANPVSQLTIIREGQAEVTITGLTPDEISGLKELHALVLEKMQGSGKKGSPEKANQMVADFKADMELAKIDNTFPTRWIKNHGVWKCVQHEAQHGRNLIYTDDDPGVLNKEAWSSK